MGLAKMEQKGREEELELVVQCCASAKGEGEEKLLFALRDGIRSS